MLLKWLRHEDQNKFVCRCLGRASRKKSRVVILIGDMDISMLIVYVKQIKEEKLRDREEYRSKNLRVGMSLLIKKVVLIVHNFINKNGLHHHLLVLLHPEIKVTIMARIRRTSKLDQHSLKKVWQMRWLGSSIC